MGQVWAAKLRGEGGFRKMVALKTLLTSDAPSGKLRRQLLEEARIASTIKSPHVAETLDSGVHDGTPFLVMEWIEGESLDDLLDAIPYPLSLRETVGIVTQLCKGLDAVHRATDAAGATLGLVHRDISPQNVMIDYTGLVKVADFGVATATGGNPKAAGGLKGKVLFMSPEEVQGKNIDARSDVFALSVLLYRLVTQTYPFLGADAGATLWMIGSEEAPLPPSARVDTCPPRLEEVILRGLSKDPQKRYSGADQFLAALELSIPPNLRGNSERQLRELMQRAFGERFQERKKRSGMAMLSLPPPAADGKEWRSSSTSRSMALSFTPTDDAVTVSQSDAPPPLAELAPRPRAPYKRAVIAAGVGLAAVGGVVVGLNVMSRESAQTIRPAERAVDLVTAAPAQSPADELATAPLPATDPSPAGKEPGESSRKKTSAPDTAAGETSTDDETETPEAARPKAKARKKGTAKKSPKSKSSPETKTAEPKATADDLKSPY